MAKHDHLTDEEKWRITLVEGHQALVRGRSVFRHIPSAPRCKVCANPFGGLGGKLFALAGWRPSRLNPNICGRCCDDLPAGGYEVDTAVLFGDIRGSTGLGESMGASAYAALLNRFYAVATRVLIRRDALIDKMIGDEVMALFVPGIAGSDYRQKAATASVDLARSIRDEFSDVGLPLGIGLHVGPAYVGNVGEGRTDFTALGDTVNVASHLQSQAAAGEVVLSADAYETAGPDVPQGELRSVELKGKSEPMTVRVVRA